MILRFSLVLEFPAMISLSVVAGGVICFIELSLYAWSCVDHSISFIVGFLLGKCFLSGKVFLPKKKCFFMWAWIFTCIF
ncbi:unnamed protein product, partial [Brassica rapa subsp. trilocularis]